MVLQQYKDIWYGYDPTTDEWVLADSRSGLRSARYSNERIDIAIDKFRANILPLFRRSRHGEYVCACGVDYGGTFDRKVDKVRAELTTPYDNVHDEYDDY